MISAASGANDVISKRRIGVATTFALVAVVTALCGWYELRQGWPGRGFVPFDCDSFSYFDLGEKLATGQSIAVTHLDSPAGRPVHWPSIVPLLIAILARLPITLGANPRIAVEAAALLVPGLCVVFFARSAVRLSLRLSPTWVGAMLYPFVLCTAFVFWAWSPTRPDHQALVSALVVVIALLAAIAATKNQTAASDHTITSFGLLCGVFAWSGILTAIPTIGVLSVAVLASRGRHRWIRWGIAAGLTSLVLYFAEYRFSARDLQLEVNHPLWSLCLFGAGCALQVVETAWLERRLTWQWAAVALPAMLGAPLAILLGKGRVFVLLDPQWKALSSVIQELGRPGIGVILAAGAPTFALAAICLWGQTEKRARRFFVVSTALSLILFAVHYRFGATSGPVIAVAGLAALGECPSGPQVRYCSFVIVAQFVAALILFVPIAITAVPDDSVVAETKTMREAAALINVPHPMLAGPLFSTVAAAYYAHGSCLGAAFWESLRELKQRDELFAAKPAVAESIARAAGLTHILVTEGELDDDALRGVYGPEWQKRNNDDTLTACLIVSRPPAWLHLENAVAFASGQRLLIYRVLPE